MSDLHFGYVLTNKNEILVQVPDPDLGWGFYLTDGEFTWEGGFGIANEWEPLEKTDPRITDEDRERLEWVFTA